MLALPTSLNNSNGNQEEPSSFGSPAVKVTSHLSIGQLSTFMVAVPLWPSSSDFSCAALQYPSWYFAPLFFPPDNLADRQRRNS
eukprot:gene3597-2538_t